MIPLADDDIMQCVVQGTNAGTPWAWVSHWKVNSSTGADSWLGQLATHIASGYLGVINTLMTDQWSADCMTVTRVAPNEMNAWFYNAGFPYDGTVATDPLPNTNAVVVRFTTDEPGARNRGRQYLCGLPEASATGGLVNASIVTTLNTIYGILTAGFSVTGNAGSMVIFSRTAYGPGPTHPPDVADYTSVVTGYNVQYNLGTIRNRRRPRSVAP